MICATTRVFRSNSLPNVTKLLVKYSGGSYRKREDPASAASLAHKYDFPQSVGMAVFQSA